MIPEKILTGLTVLVNDDMWDDFIRYLKFREIISNTALRNLEGTDLIREQGKAKLIEELQGLSETIITARAEYQREKDARRNTS